jgi:hypothetical protein
MISVRAFPKRERINDAKGFGFLPGTKGPCRMLMATAKEP